MSYTFVEQNKRAEAVCVSDIPSLISSQAITKPSVYAQTDTRVIINSAGTIVNGGSSNFFLNTTANSFIKSGSVALNFNLAVTCSGTGANSFGFGSGPIGQASALINRITVTCGQVTESIQNYAQVADIITLNKTTKNFAETELAAMSGASLLGTLPYGNTAQTFVYNLNVTVPVLVGLFNSSDSYLPICLMSSQPQILVEWNSNLYQAFCCSAGQTVTNYTVNNLIMTYNNVEVDASYVNELKMLMRERDFVYSFSAQNLMSVQIGPQTTISQEFGLDCQSLVGIKYTNWNNAATSFQAQNLFVCDGQTLANAYLDGRVLISGTVLDCIQRPSLVYAVNRQSWNELWDTSSSYCVIPSDSANPLTVQGTGTTTNNSQYLIRAFTGGFPTQNYQEIGLGFSGSRCVKCRLEVNKLNSGATFYVLFIRDAVYSIGRDGGLVMHM